jgi:hypothetical protein
MRRLHFLTAAVALAALPGCNVFGGSADPPTGFEGWYHLDRPGRATSLSFSTYNLAEVRDLGCDQVRNGETPWASDGSTVSLPQWSTPAPSFTQSSTPDGGLLANPGMYGTAQEQWLPGATCLICPQGDAGVAVACSQPAVLDGGT